MIYAINNLRLYLKSRRNADCIENPRSHACYVATNTNHNGLLRYETIQEQISLDANRGVANHANSISWILRLRHWIHSDNLEIYTPHMAYTIQRATINT